MDKSSTAYCCEEYLMDSNTSAIIMAVIAVGATVGIGLASLFVISIGRLGARMTGLETRVSSLEKEVARIVGLLEGLGLTGKMPPNDARQPNRSAVHD